MRNDNACAELMLEELGVMPTVGVVIGETDTVTEAEPVALV
jgi:hypothetical protein